MKILKKYKEANAKWEEISVSQFKEETEGKGYWQRGTAVSMIQKGQEIFTPFAIYKLGEENEYVIIHKETFVEKLQELQRYTESGVIRFAEGRYGGSYEGFFDAVNYVSEEYTVIPLSKNIVDRV